jgi:NADH-quinone oxidoreductase subunit G
MEIGTFIEKSVDHELSGNIIDLCPVGALNNKAYRYRARAWEMTQRPLISPHDCVGTNLNGHVLRGRLMRVVPRDNEAINETWIADRDRYSCEGLYTDDRAALPLVKQDGEWREVDWESALEAAAKGLQKVVREHGAAQVGVLASPIATLEELYLTGRVGRGLGTDHIDHRLRRVDFRDQANDPLAPTLGCSLVELGSASSVLIVGSNLRKEVPLIAHRVRQAAVKQGARVAVINPRRLELQFSTIAQLTSNGLGMPQHVAGVLVAASSAAGRSVPAHLSSAVQGITLSPEHARIAEALTQGELRVILLGAIAQNHAAYSEIRALARALAEATGARLGFLPEGGNAVGAALAGVTPHRGVGGLAVRNPGLSAAEMVNAKLRAYVLVGGIETDDLAAPSRGESTLAGADCVVALTPYVDDKLRAVATVILPVAAFAETSGTWVNVRAASERHSAGRFGRCCACSATCSG